MWKPEIKNYSLSPGVPSMEWQQRKYNFFGDRKVKVGKNIKVKKFLMYTNVKEILDEPENKLQTKRLPRIAASCHHNRL